MQLKEAVKTLKESGYIVESTGKFTPCKGTYSSCIITDDKDNKYYVNIGIRGTSDITILDVTPEKVIFEVKNYGPENKTIVMERQRMSEGEELVFKYDCGWITPTPEQMELIEAARRKKQEADAELWEKVMKDVMMKESGDIGRAASLLNESFDMPSPEEIAAVRKRLSQEQMLTEDIDGDSTFDEVFNELTSTRDVWLKELQTILPEGYHAEPYTGSCACTLSKKIPGINITHDVVQEPGKYILVNDQNPRKIEFEGVGPCTLNGRDHNVAIHYPGIRRMATRFTLPAMYNYKRAVANFVNEMLKK